MLWKIVNRAEERAAALADRHYIRQSIGSRQFTPPGRVLVLLTAQADAVWATSWPYPQYVHRICPDAWVCTLFRNESPHLATDLIRDAIAATVWKWGAAPSDGMVTMIDWRHVKPTMVRGEAVYGWTYRKLGFQEVGRTKDRDLIVLQLLPEHMPAPEMPGNGQRSLWTLSRRDYAS